MVVVDDVAILVDVPRLHEESRGFALDMVGVKGVRWKAALVVLKDRLVYASLMVVAAGASMRDVQRGPKGALCIARHMVVESVAYFKGAPRVLKEAHHYARDMVEESAAFLMVVGFALRVYMEALISVLLMVGERGVLCRAAQKVPVAALIVVSGMVEESGASLTAVEKVPKGAQTSARPMVGENDALGERENVRNLPEARVVYVLLIAAWSWSGRRAREVSLDRDFSTDLYLQLQLQEAVLITLIRLQESVSSLTALIHWKTQGKGISYPRRCWFLYQ